MSTIRLFNYIGTQAATDALHAAEDLVPADITTTVEIGTASYATADSASAPYTVIWTIWENATESSDTEVEVDAAELAETLRRADREVNGLIWKREDVITVEVAASAAATADIPVAA